MVYDITPPAASALVVCGDLKHLVLFHWHGDVCAKILDHLPSPRGAMVREAFFGGSRLRPPRELVVGGVHAS